MVNSFLSFCLNHNTLIIIDLYFWLNEECEWDHQAVYKWNKFQQVVSLAFIITEKKGRNFKVHNLQFRACKTVLTTEVLRCDSMISPSYNKTSVLGYDDFYFWIGKGCKPLLSCLCKIEFEISNALNHQ